MLRSSRAPPSGARYSKLEHCCDENIDNDVSLNEHARKTFWWIRFCGYCLGLIAFVSLLACVSGIFVGIVSYNFYTEFVRHVTSDQNAAVTSSHVNAALMDTYTTISNARDISGFAANVTNTLWHAPYRPDTDALRPILAADPDKSTAGQKFTQNALDASSALREVAKSIDGENINSLLVSTNRLVSELKARDVVDDVKMISGDVFNAVHIFLKDKDAIEDFKSSVGAMIQVFKNHEFSGAVVEAAGSVSDLAKKATEEIDPGQIHDLVQHASELDVKKDVLPRVDRLLDSLQWTLSAMRRMAATPQEPRA